MSEIRIYGASDDLVVVDGDISEEFSVDPCYLGISDGTVLSVTYDRDGCWRVNVIERGSAKVTRLDAEGPDADDRPGGEPGYSDLVTLQADKLTWVICGKDLARS